MQNSIKKIILIALLILILPIVTFFIYQFSTLNDAEEELNKIYLQQLETIIYSVNQYSEDVVTSWINDLSTQLRNNKNLDSIKFSDSQKEIIKSTCITDVDIDKLKIFNNNSVTTKIDETHLKEFLLGEKQLLEKLQNYLESGYQRIEPIGLVGNSNTYLCLFPLNKSELGWEIGGIVFDANSFIQQLSSKISQAAGEDFILLITSETNNILLSSDRTDANGIILSKPLWLLPGLSLGIKLKNGSIQELVAQRFYTNLFILGLLLFILVIGMLLIFYNLRKELKLAQLKSDFIANVSHELRTPLALISMYSETLVLGRLKNDEKKSEYYSVINNEANRLSKIVNTILNFSKMEKQSRKFNFENSDLREISDEVFRTYDYHIKSKGFTYLVNIDDKNVESIYADVDAVSESMINLIDNALKYSKDEKKFEVLISSNNIGMFWEIRDFGVGVGSEDQKKIFEKFYRVSSGLVNSTKGTGLGLSLIKQIMEEHHGDVTVESKLGEGSRFRLQFNKNFKGNN